MTCLWDRRSPRTSLNAPVTVWNPDSGADHGTALDVSLGGMFVGLAEPLDVGRPVICQLQDDNGMTLEVPGRVAWCKLDGDHPGMGVAFDELDGAMRSQVRRMVGDNAANGEPVRVAFEGLDPLRARAWVAGEGIRVATALPFLRLGSQTELYVEGELPASGAVRGVRLAYRDGQSVPHLEIEISIQKRPDGLDAAGSSPVIELPVAAPQWVEPAVERTVRMRTGRKRGWATAALCLVAGGALALALAAQPDAASRATQTPTTDNPVPNTDPAPNTDNPAPTADNAAPTTDDLASTDDPAPTTDHRPPTTDDLAPTTDDLAPNTDDLAPNTDDPAPTADTPAPTTETPRVRFGEIRIPIEGQPSYVRHYRLADPNGVAINLPGASTPWKLGVHRDAVRDSPAHRLWLRDHKGGLQARILWNKRRVDYTVDLEDGELVVQLSSAARR